MKQHLSSKLTNLSSNLPKVCPTCCEEFSAGTAPVSCPNDNTLLAPMSPSLIGTMIDGRYNIVSQLRKGGWGEVFLAEHAGLNRNVALKILHLNLVSDPERVKRFQAEAEAASKLKHPNIVSVHDYGLTRDGRPFIVMDYVDGQNLTELLDGAPMAPSDAIWLLLQLTDALIAAHQQDIIHRDIKPGNIMIASTKAGAQRALLLDFGIAKTIHAEESKAVTRTGEVLGTPAYMSPEQCRGLALDGRSDIYSLGCVFYEMLSAVPIVTANNTFDYMNWHLNGKMPSLSAVDRLLPGVERLIMRMTAKSPEERYQNMHSLKADLELVLAGTPVNLAVPRAQRSGARKSRVLLPAVSLTAVAVLGAGSFVAQQFHPQPLKGVTKSIIVPVNPTVKEETTERIAPSQFANEVAPQTERSDYYSVTEFGRRLRLVNEVAANLKREGDTTAASRLEKIAAASDAIFRNLSEVPAGAEPQVLVVGCYEGDQKRTLSNTGLVEANINYSRHPVILILSSYSPVLWRLHIAKGVTIRQIVLNGYEEGSTIENPPAGVPVKQKKQAYLPYEFTEITAPELRDKSLSECGKAATAMVGSYSGETLELGSSNIDFRAQMALHALAPAYHEADAARSNSVAGDLSKISFWAVGSTKTDFPHMFDSSVYLFNGLGPVRKSKLDLGHSDLTNVVYAPDEDAFYGVTNHDFFRMPKPGGKNELFVTKNKVEMSWICGITYDTKRKRVLVSADGKDNSTLFAYTPASHQWSILKATGPCWMGKFSSMYYDREQDKIFAIPHNPSGGNVNMITQMTPDGVVEKTVRLDSPILLPTGPEGGVHLKIENGLALVVTPTIENHDSSDGAAIPQKMYVYKFPAGKLIKVAPVEFQ